MNVGGDLLASPPSSFSRITLVCPISAMPVYEFSCANGCENYEVWRSIDERKSQTDCPACGGNGIRLFNPPMTLTGSFRLKKEVAEPRLVRKEAGDSDTAKPRLRESGTRPWMLNRGC
jgi:putative FmdB family regulatory protein